MRLCSKRSPQPARLRHAAPILALLLAATPAHAAGGVKVDVVVDGLTAEMKRNVLGSMMLAGAAAEGRLSEGEARRLATRARREIEQALQPFGYYRPVIEDELDTRGDPWKARYVVQPGPPLPLSAVNVRVTGPGAELPRVREIIRNFPLKPGDRLQHAPYEALKMQLNRFAAQNGYLDAAFTTSVIAVDLTSYTARIDVQFETGPRYYFGPVRFEQSVLDTAFVRSFVTFKTGEPYNADSLTAMQNALGASPYFSRVEVEPRRDQAADLVVPIDVRLEAAQGLRYTVGAGYGTDTGFQGEAALEFRRLNRKGHRAKFNLLVSENRNSVGAQYQTPRAFGREQLLTYSIALIDEETDAQKARGGSVGAALTRERGGWEESFGLYFQRQTFTVGVDHGTPNLLSPELSWTYRRSDNRLQPRQGYYLKFRCLGASDRMVSDVSFVQANLLSKGILSAGPRGRVLARAEVGGTQTHDFHALPPHVRYFAGGAQSVRAYGYQDLGPHDSSGEPLGGQRLLFGSAEYDYRVFGDFGVAAFYDIGNALERFTDPLADGAGAGLRWASPVGMVRFDIAWPIGDPSPGHLQFSIGPDL